MEKTYTFTSTGTDCIHANGTYFSVYFWFFRKKLFWCDDCLKAIPVEKLLPTNQ